MAEIIGVTVDDRELKKALAAISNKTVKDVMAESLTKTAFDVRDAERRHVSTIFEFAGSSTRQFFVSKSAFRIKQARPSKLESQIFPAPRTGEILAEHVNRQRLVEKQHLVSFTGPNGIQQTRFAIPINARRRGARGTVPKGTTPAELIKNKKGFVKGSIVFERVGKKRKSKRRQKARFKGVRAVYFLTDNPSNPPVFEWVPVATKAAELNFTKQVKRAMRKEFPPGSRFRP